MELADGTRDVVDPEVRAYVSSLVTALGGSGGDEDGAYVLGDEALACLRDIKRWLRLYDTKANRMDVARCLAELNIVGGDLLPILALWRENETENRFKAKAALGCLEVLVPLTWPVEKVDTMTNNHHRHIPFLQLAQIAYKRLVINFDGARILHTAVRIALPSMAEAPGDRKSRDEGIIMLALYFLRNIAMIAPAPNMQFEGDESEISRSATIDAFSYQDIFHLLLTLSSSMGEEFNTQDVLVMEIIFHLVKGVDPEKLFMNEEQLGASNTNELIGLRVKEARMKRGYARTAPTRHNRFGTMIWVKRDDAKVSAVSGQDALLDGGRSLAKMDKTKKYRPPLRATKEEQGYLDFDTPVTLKAPAIKQLRSFVEDFLDSGFNPLFHHVQKAIDRQPQRVLDYHSRQFFYLVSWFLETERARRKSKKPGQPQQDGDGSNDADNFSLVASVLTQEMFITLNRAMHKENEDKSWQNLKAAMRCFTQILLTIQEMSESPLVEDQDIAENILNRIFYEESTHDLVAHITRYFKDQGFGYLDACTQFAHVYLRMLENYSKQNVDLQVRSRRRARRKKKVEESETTADTATLNLDDDGEDSGAEDDNEVEAMARERKFDFKRFAARFCTQGCVDTFVKFCSFYDELNSEQLKRAHRFFYRVAFKMDMSVMLFRVDIIALLHKMIKGPEGLDSASPVFKEWDELVRQILKHCTRKIQERPQLIIEMLFSKINSTAHYLEYGYEKQTATTKSRPAAELQVKPGMEWKEQVAVVVSALLDMSQADHLEWVKGQLSSAESQRKELEQMTQANEALTTVESGNPSDSIEPSVPTMKALEAPPIVVRPDNDQRRVAIFKNGHLRLLMTLVGWTRLGDDDDPEGLWIISGSLSSNQLKASLDLIKSTEFSPPVFDDGKEALNFIRRKANADSTSSRTRAAFDDDSDNGIDDDEMIFPAGGPTNMTKNDALAKLKQTRRRRRRDSESEEPDLEELRERNRKRREKDLEKIRKVKSELLVNEDDEMSDEERDKDFFEREEQLRKLTNAAAVKELLKQNKSESSTKAVEKAGRKRMSSAISDDSESDELGLNMRKKRRSSSISAEGIDKIDEEDGDDDEISEDTDTPLSSPHIRSSQTKKLRLSDSDSEDVDTRGHKGPATTGGRTIRASKDVSMFDVGEKDEADDDDDLVPAVGVRRRRTVSGFVADSSDEE